MKHLLGSDRSLLPRAFQSLTVLVSSGGALYMVIQVFTLENTLGDVVVEIASGKTGQVSLVAIWTI